MATVLVAAVIACAPSTATLPPTTSSAGASTSPSFAPATPAPSVSASPQGASTYHDCSYQFEIGPRGVATACPPATPGASPDVGLRQVVAFGLAESQSAGTNGSAQLAVAASRDAATVGTCLTPPTGPPGFGPGPADTVIVNGTLWTPWQDSGVGMHHTRLATVHRAVRGDACYEVVFRTVVADLDMYAPGAVRQFDPTPAKAAFNALFQTFRFTGVEFIETVVATSRDDAWLLASEDTTHDGGCRAQHCTVQFLVHTRDAGRTWSSVEMPADSVREVHFVDSNTGWLITDGCDFSRQNCYHSALFATSDGGRSWRQQTWYLGAPAGGIFLPDHSSSISSLVFVDRTHGWATVAQPCDAQSCVGIVRTTDGERWGQVSRGMVVGNNQMLRMVDSQVGWISVSWGGQAAIYTTRDGGETWRRQFHADGGRPYLDIDFIDRTHGWALGYDLDSCATSGCSSYSLYRTDDGGESWETLQQPLRWNSDCTTLDGSGAGFLVGLKFTDTSVGWIPTTRRGGTGQVGIIATSDGGRTFTRSCAAGDIRDLSALSLVDARVGWVVASAGQGGELPGGFSGFSRSRLERTDDGGKTWTRLIPDIH